MIHEDEVITQISVTAFQKETHTVYVCDATGVPYVNLAQLERMFPNAAKTTLWRRLELVPRVDAKTSVISTSNGSKLVPLYPPSVVFDLAFEFNQPLAKRMGAAGAAVYMYGLAGYQVKPEKQFTVPQTLEDALIFAANEIKQRKLLEQQKELLESQVEILEEDNERQSEIIDELFDYSSIIRIAKFNNISETNFKWSMLKVASKKLGMEIKTAPCPRYVKKNLYHHDAWRLAYPGVSLPETTTLVIRAN